MRTPSPGPSQEFRKLTSPKSARDDAAADPLTQRLQAHEKMAWMLRSLLK